MKIRTWWSYLGVFVLLLAFTIPLRAHAEDWLPIDPQDLAMKDNPKHPGDDAMVLWRDERTDCSEGIWTVYVRLKIFDERGREQANIETQPYAPAEAHINSIKGRTIHPDGSIVPFSGDAMEKRIAKRGTSGLVAKAFVLPDATPGSIIEYQYTLGWDKRHPYPVIWQVQGRLFQRKAHFVFLPMEQYWMRPSPGSPQWNQRLAANTSSAYTPLYEVYSWVSLRLPPDQIPVQRPVAGGGKHGELNQELDEVTLDIADLPGYKVEPLMSPPEEVAASVHFFHFPYWFSLPSPEDFWKKEGKTWKGKAEGYMNKHDAVEKELHSLLDPSESSDAKLRKIYDRVQSLRNLTYKLPRTGQECKPENEGPLLNVEEVLRKGCGNHDDLNRTFVALAREAGFDATLLSITQRNRAYFHKFLLDLRQLNAEIAVVRDGDKELYFDPGTASCPFGILPWEFTSAMGLRLDEHPPVFANTPIPEAENATVSRRANLKLNADGSLQGTVEVTFTGQEALDRRLQERDEDDAAHKKDMEELLRGWLPAKAMVELQKVNDWKASGVPLIATYQIAISGYAAAGSRTILPTAVFSGAYRTPFVAAQRENPVIFPFPYIHSDDITITLPSGSQVEALPHPKSVKNGAGEFITECKNENGVVHATRKFRSDGFVIESKYYPALRRFFSMAGSTSDEQVVLKAAGN